MFDLRITKRTDPDLLQRMINHYSHPKGFVGRNICYSIYYNNEYYGHIVGGSSTLFLPGRNEYFGITKSPEFLNKIVNNIFFNVSKIHDKYPERNFTTKCLKVFMEKIRTDWENKYKDKVIGFESLVEKPRTGDLYLKAGWKLVGETIGYTCKRIAGEGTDKWTGKRIWNTSKQNLKPKLVFCYKLNG